MKVFERFINHEMSKNFLFHTTAPLYSVMSKSVSLIYYYTLSVDFNIISP